MQIEARIECGNSQPQGRIESNCDERKSSLADILQQPFGLVKFEGTGCGLIRSRIDKLRV